MILHLDQCAYIALKMCIVLFFFLKTYEYVFQQNYHDCTEQEIYTEYLPNTYVCAIVLFFISRFLAKLAEEANSSASNQGQIVYLVCPNSAKFWQEMKAPRRFRGGSKASGQRTSFCSPRFYVHVYGHTATA